VPDGGDEIDSAAQHLASHQWPIKGTIHGEAAVLFDLLFDFPNVLRRDVHPAVSKPQFRNE
jgi:hypothetical protein